MIRILFALSLLAALPAYAAERCEVGEPFPYLAPYETMGECAQDIQSWMERLGACAHFQDELAERTGEDLAETKKQMAELKCDAIACDYEALFAKYEGNITEVGVITGYAATVYGEDYDLTCKK